MPFKRPPLELTPKRGLAMLIALLLIAVGLAIYAFHISGPIELFSAEVIDLSCHTDSEGSEQCAPVTRYADADQQIQTYTPDSTSSPPAWSIGDPALVVEINGEPSGVSTMFLLFLPVFLLTVGLFVLSNVLMVIGWRDIAFVPPVTLFGRSERSNHGFEHDPEAGADLLDYLAHRDIVPGDSERGGVEIRAPRSRRFLFALDLVVLASVSGFICALLALLIEIPVPDSWELIVDLSVTPLLLVLLVFAMARRATSGGLGYREQPEDRPLNDLLFQLLSRLRSDLDGGVLRPIERGWILRLERPARRLVVYVEVEGSHLHAYIGHAEAREDATEDARLGRFYLPHKDAEQFTETRDLRLPLDAPSDAAESILKPALRWRAVGESLNADEVSVTVEDAAEVAPPTEASAALALTLEPAQPLRQPDPLSGPKQRMVDLSHVAAGVLGLLLWGGTSYLFVNPDLLALTNSYHIAGLGALAIQWVSCWPMRPRGEVLRGEGASPVPLRYQGGVLETEDASLDLTRPFRVQLSRSPEGAASNSLLVELRGERGAEIEFAVPVEASEAFEALHAMAHPHTPRLAPSSARALWEALRFHAEAGGAPLEVALIGSGTPRADAG